jgi:hypothetical protein
MTFGQNEDDLAAQLVGFLGQFLEVFYELKGKKFYLSGESVRVVFVLACSHRLAERSNKRQYAGMYVPCECKDCMRSFLEVPKWHWFCRYRKLHLSESDVTGPPPAGHLAGRS